MTRSLVTLQVLLAVLSGSLRAQDGPDVADLGAERRTALAVHLAAHLAGAGEAPIDYVADKLAAHDVVLLGESHQVRENCELVAGLLAPLYRRAGLRGLATEFLRRRHTARANEIVTAPRYDEAAVVALFRDGPWPTWGYREYMDILRAAWQLNHSLPDGAEPLTIAGLDDDWSQHALWFGGIDQRERFQILLDRERTMTEGVRRHLARAKKILVHVGYAHSVTTQGERLGTVLRRDLGEAVFQICLHHQLPTRGTACRMTQLLEQSLALSGLRRVGFDVAGSPFAALRDTSCGLWQAMPTAGLADFAQGYVILHPIAGLHRVSWSGGFVDAEHFEAARDIAVRMKWVGPESCKTAADLDRHLAAVFPPLGPPPGSAARWREIESEIRGRFADVTQLSLADYDLLRARSPETPPLLVDVRAHEEYTASSIPGARHVPWGDDFTARLGPIAGDRDVVLYCSVGWRSSAAATACLRAGMTGIFNLEGSIFAWGNDGRALAAPDGPATVVHPFDDEWGKLLWPRLRAPR